MTKYIIFAVVAMGLSACSPSPSSENVSESDSSQALPNEIVYDMNNPTHREDMICIAALGVGRDAAFGQYNQFAQQNKSQIDSLTDIQNELILKYAYSSKLNQHVEARKIYLVQVEGIDHVNDLIKKCSAR